jgi:hypothetical protein
MRSVIQSQILDNLKWKELWAVKDVQADRDEIARLDGSGATKKVPTELAESGLTLGVVSVQITKGTPKVVTLEFRAYIGK